MARPERRLTPDKSALDRLGYELRELRKARKLSQARLAKMVHVSDDTIQKSETAQRRPARDLVKRLDVALDAGGCLLRLLDDVDRESRHTDRHTGDTDNSTVGIPGIRPGVHLVPAEDMMAMYADLSAPTGLSTDGGALPTVLNGLDLAPTGEELVMVPCRTPDGGITWMSVPRRAFLIGGMGVAGAAMVGASESGAAASPRSAPVVDGSQVAHFKHMRRVLMDSDNLFGPRRVITTLEQQLRQMQYLRQNGRGSTDHHNELVSIQTQFADLCGWLHQDSGHFREAQFWLDRALEWAHTSCDTEAAAFILARKSQLAGDAGDAATSIGVAHAAIAMAKPNSRAKAIAMTYAGHGHALSGDKAASQRAYDKARELLGSVSDTGLQYGFFLDAPYIEVQRARSLATLGEHGAAAQRFQEAIVSLPEGFHRDKGVYLAREAIAHACAEEIDRAAEVGLKALSIGAETGSSRILTELDGLSASLQKWSDVPAATEFRNAMRNQQRT
ncbi:helix-turn-helix domain-containing protein [Spirillospora sp. CA-294931]|uniref:helix-turn-helix domain-containing protein n=1 Tax=Spirillospora sp. CA-294931 TaxID=3240042 RepID=UPI003D89C538